MSNFYKIFEEVRDSNSNLSRLVELYDGWWEPIQTQEDFALFSGIVKHDLNLSDEDMLVLFREAIVLGKIDGEVGKFVEGQEKLGEAKLNEADPKEEELKTLDAPEEEIAKPDDKQEPTPEEGNPAPDAKVDTSAEGDQTDEQMKADQLPEKEYFGTTGDTHYMLVRKATDAGDIEDVIIEDQTEEQVWSAKEKGIDFMDMKQIIKSAVDDLDIEMVSTDIIVDYELLEEEEPETEEIDTGIPPAEANPGDVGGAGMESLAQNSKYISGIAAASGETNESRISEGRNEFSISCIPGKANYIFSLIKERDSNAIAGREGKGTIWVVTSLSKEDMLKIQEIGRECVISGPFTANESKINEKSDKEYFVKRLEDILYNYGKEYSIFTNFEKMSLYSAIQDIKFDNNIAAAKNNLESVVKSLTGRLSEEELGSVQANMARELLSRMGSAGVGVIENGVVAENKIQESLSNDISQSLINYIKDSAPLSKNLGQISEEIKREKSRGTYSQEIALDKVIGVVKEGARSAYRVEKDIAPTHEAYPTENQIRETAVTLLGQIEERRINESVEEILYGTRVGDEDWQEEVLTTYPDRFGAAKAWAMKNGFDRFRVARIDMSDKPDFGGTVRESRINEGMDGIDKVLKAAGVELMWRWMPAKDLYIAGINDDVANSIASQLNGKVAGTVIQDQRLCYKIVFESKERVSEAKTMQELLNTSAHYTSIRDIEKEVPKEFLEMYAKHKDKFYLEQIADAIISDMGIEPSQEELKNIKSWVYSLGRSEEQKKSNKNDKMSGQLKDKIKNEYIDKKVRVIIGRESMLGNTEKEETFRVVNSDGKIYLMSPRAKNTGILLDNPDLHILKIVESMVNEDYDVLASGMDEQTAKDLANQKQGYAIQDPQDKEGKKWIIVKDKENNGGTV